MSLDPEYLQVCPKMKITPNICSQLVIRETQGKVICALQEYDTTWRLKYSLHTTLLYYHVVVEHSKYMNVPPPIPNLMLQTTPKTNRKCNINRKL